MAISYSGPSPGPGCPPEVGGWAKEEEEEAAGEQALPSIAR